MKVKNYEENPGTGKPESKSIISIKNAKSKLYENSYICYFV